MTETRTEVTGFEPPPDRLRPRRRGPVWILVVVVLLAGAGTGAWLWWNNVYVEPPPPAASPVSTVVVQLGTITATDTWDGTLGYGTSLTVNSGAEGVITRSVDAGDAVERGDELFRVNEQPVIILDGVVPMYRDLAPGNSGIDVEQLERNLSELGYDGYTVDEEYTTGTAAAVSEWQDDIGAEETGTVSRSSVVFLPAGSRVDTLWLDVGDSAVPGAPVLDITAPNQIVEVEAEVDDREWFAVDTEVTVVLSDDQETRGTVSAVTVVDVPAENAEGGAAATEQVLQVEISLDENVSEEFVGSTVDVNVAIDEREDVLLVPVNALLALAEGGYGLEVVNDDGTTEFVPVTTGLFANGMVEVEGDGIADGTVVGVAGR